MAVDGLGALALGSLFDRIGIWTMALATIVSAAAAPLVFLGNFPLTVIGMACWGLGTGAQDSVMRATISRLSPQQRRATAFGIMNAVYGVAWFAGSVLLGVLYDPLARSGRPHLGIVASGGLTHLRPPRGARGLDRQ